jgi:hypothetical protein
MLLRWKEKFKSVYEKINCWKIRREAHWQGKYFPTGHAYRDTMLKVQMSLVANLGLVY